MTTGCGLGLWATDTNIDPGCGRIMDSDTVLGSSPGSDLTSPGGSRPISLAWPLWKYVPPTPARPQGGKQDPRYQHDLWSLMIPEVTDINTDPGYVKITGPDMVLNCSPGLDPTILPCDTTGHLDHINFLIMNTIT